MNNENSCLHIGILSWKNTTSKCLSIVKAQIHQTGKCILRNLHLGCAISDKVRVETRKI